MSLFYQHDQSTSANEMFGMDTSRYYEMMDAFSPPGLTPDAKRRLSNQVLDAVGLPGTSAPTSEESNIGRLADGISLALGTDNATGGLLDTGWKSIKRNAIGSITSFQDLQQRVNLLQSQKADVLTQVKHNIAMCLHQAGYEGSHATRLSEVSMYYRISKENLEGYLNLHIDLLTRCVERPFSEVKAILSFHARKLSEPRTMHQVRLQMICRHYTYFLGVLWGSEAATETHPATAQPRIRYGRPQQRRR